MLIDKIAQRETAFKNLMRTCFGLEHEEELLRKLPTAKKKASEVTIPSKRGKVQEEANTVISRTEEILASIPKFLSAFNEAFSVYYVRKLIYSGVDYRFVAQRETQEIVESLNVFDLKLRQFSDQHSGQ